MSRRHKVSENFQFVYISEITIILSSLERLRICSRRTGFLLLCHIIMCLLVFVIYACDFNLILSIGNLRFYICAYVYDNIMMGYSNNIRNYLYEFWVYFHQWVYTFTMHYIIQYNIVSCLGNKTKLVPFMFTLHICI